MLSASVRTRPTTTLILVSSRRPIGHDAALTSRPAPPSHDATHHPRSARKLHEHLRPAAGRRVGPDHWHLVVPLLRAAGHEAVTPDLPCESDTAGLPAYTEAALTAIGDRDDLVVVGQSLGAFTAAAVAAARPTRALVSSTR